MIDVKEVGAVSYLMVKNEKEFYEAFFYLPSNLRSKTPSDDTPETFMGKFTGKLLLTNLENKQNFLLDYKDGNVSDAYKKQMLANKKLSSVGAYTTSSYGADCQTVVIGCTYVTLGEEGNTPIVYYTSICTEPFWSGPWTLTDVRTRQVCEEYPDPPVDPNTGDPIGGGGGGGTPDPENPDEDEYTLTVIADPINLTERFECFDNVPTNANTLYSVKICADVPNNSDPNDLLHGGSPGHAFLELTKTTGGISVTQTIGFYPANYHLAKFQQNVPSQVVDNEYHTYDASLIKMLNAAQFNSMLAASMTAANHQYQMVGYNCTQFALDVFNSQGYTLTIPITPGLGGILGYGKTPNGLYKDIKNKYNNQYPGASAAIGNGVDSSECN